MNANLRSLIKACEKSNTKYRILHPNGNLIQIITEDHSFIFCNWSTPINSQAIARLCEDKEYTYKVLSDHLCMPKTIAYLDPNIDERHKEYLKYSDIDSIVGNIIQEFRLPVIVKRNRGSHGSNVFQANSPAEIKNAIEIIFNKNSKNYDYVALAQKQVDIVEEYRAVFFKKKLMFAYLKSIENAKYVGNLSPLHWEGGMAVAVQDESLLNRIEKFTLPALEHANMLYAGVDIALDQKGKMWCIEINSSPGFDIFIKCCGDKSVVELYTAMLKWFYQKK